VAVAHTRFQVQAKRVHAETKDAVHIKFTSWHAIFSGMPEMRVRDVSSNTRLKETSVSWGNIYGNEATDDDVSLQLQQVRRRKPKRRFSAMLSTAQEVRSIDISEAT
jgi:hypothetical protein